MVELRSGTTTGGNNTRTPGTRDPNIPENIVIASQGDLAASRGSKCTVAKPKPKSRAVTICSASSLCWRNLPSNSDKSSTRYTTI